MELTKEGGVNELRNGTRAPGADLPADVAAIREALDAGEARAERLLHSVDDQALVWQPDGGRAWSIAQCLDHLAVMNRVYLAPMRDAARAGASRARRGPISPGFLGGWFARSMEPPARLRTKAPRAARPSGEVDRARLWDSFREAHLAVVSLLEETASLDQNRIRFANPFLPGLRWRLGAGFLIIAAHERRHLWQAENVKKAYAARLSTLGPPAN
jgi:hypothetical protein